MDLFNFLHDRTSRRAVGGTKCEHLEVDDFSVLDGVTGHQTLSVLAGSLWGSFGQAYPSTLRQSTGEHGERLLSVSYDDTGAFSSVDRTWRRRGISDGET